jgi:DNA-binding MarR family transcriptional regulator
LDIDRFQYVLVIIDDNGELLSQQALAEDLQVDKSYVVTIVNYLEGNGYVKREKNPNDKREQLIKLTEKGRRVVPKIREVTEQLNQRALENLTVEQTETFIQVLNQIDANLVDIKPFNILINYKTHTHDK